MAKSKKPPVYFHFPRPFALHSRTVLKEFIVGIFRREQVPLDELHVIFCSDKYLLEMNRQYLQHDYFTDVITFPLSGKGEPVHGEIYISVDRVADNARSLQTSFLEEIHRVIFHGVLHLCGYKDKSKVEIAAIRAKEDFYLARYFK